MKINVLGFLFITALICYYYDIAILKAINLNRDTSLDFLFTCITNSAAPLAYGIPFLLLMVGLIKGNSLQQKNAFYIIVSVLLCAAITSIFKYSINRPRPFITYSFLQSIAEGGSPSFPSGHTCDAFVLATAISLAYKKWYIAIPFFLWAFSVGYSRIDLGVHYPSDVLGGIIIGSGSALLCNEIRKQFNKQQINA